MSDLPPCPHCGEVAGVRTCDLVFGSYKRVFAVGGYDLSSKSEFGWPFDTRRQGSVIYCENCNRGRDDVVRVRDDLVAALPLEE